MSNQKFTVIGADWCGFTKKLVGELDAAGHEYDYIECSQPDSHPACKLVRGYPHTVAGGKEDAADHMQNPQCGSAGYQPAASHPAVTGDLQKQCRASGGGGGSGAPAAAKKKKAKKAPRPTPRPSHAAKATAKKSASHTPSTKSGCTVIGAEWCGYTRKFLEELELENVDFDYIDCTDRVHELCTHENVKGYPTTACGKGAQAKKNLDKGRHVAGYRPPADHPIANHSQCGAESDSDDES